MKYSSTEPRNFQINLRVNNADKAMLEAIRNSIRPRITTSRILLYLAEERAREMGILDIRKDGTWTIDDGKPES